MARKVKRGSGMRKRVRKQATQRKSGGGGGTKFNLPEGVTFFTPKKGNMAFDIIPYVVTVDKHPAGIEKGDIWYERSMFVHYSVGPEEKTYICPRTVNKRCPICEYRTKLSKSDDVDDKTLDQLRARERALYNVIDLDARDEGIQLWEMSYYLFGKKLDEELDEGDEELGDFPLPEDGLSLKVRFAEKQMGKITFLETSRIDFKQREEQYTAAICDDATDLDAILNILPFDQLENIFLGMDDDEEDEGSSADDAADADAPDESANDAPADDEGSSADDDAADAEEAKAEAAKKKRKEAAKKKREDKKAADAKAAEEASDDGADDNAPECPGGGVFGKNTDEFDECDACKQWDACIDKKEG